MRIIIFSHIQSFVTKCSTILIFIFLSNSLLFAFEINEKPMTFQIIKPCHGTASFCAPYVLANGTIEENTYIKLDKFLKNNYSNKICLNSPGGDVLGGMNLGEYIRSANLDTCLLKKYEKSIMSYDKNKEIHTYEIVTVIDKPICTSACFYAFVGGVNRVLENFNGMTLLGIHQFYNPNKNKDEGNAQILTTLGYRFLDKMGVKREVLDVASFTPKDEITFLPSYITRKYRVNTNEPPLIEWNINVSDDGKIYGAVLQQHSNKDAITSLFISNDHGKPTLTIFFTYSSDRESQEVLRSLNVNIYRKSNVGYGEIRFVVDGQTISEYKNLKWKSTQKNTVDTSLEITEVVLNKMANGNILDIQANVANAYRDVDPSTEISLEGFKKIYLALFKN